MENSNIVKEWRKSKGLTQEKAARALGISYRHYQRIESGHSPITETIEILIELLETKNTQSDA